MAWTEGRLRDRINREGINEASSFRDRATAEHAVNRTLEVNRSRLESWLEKSQPGDRQSFSHEMNEPLGLKVTRGKEGTTTPTTSWVLLERSNSTPGGYRIITGFPR
ncbi:MAG: hypothetical protein JNK87_41765 [Bryobacterales bacterium]|nr:hypothetical protein [Bryobacterales bacterium]